MFFRAHWRTASKGVESRSYVLRDHSIHRVQFKSHLAEQGTNHYTQQCILIRIVCAVIDEVKFFHAEGQTDKAAHRQCVAVA